MSRGRIAGLLAWACVFAAIQAGAASAQEEIPSLKILTCEGNCPVLTPPKKLNHPTPGYPAAQLDNDNGSVEGLVDVAFAIGADGHVKNAVVEKLVGPQAFADSALATIGDWTYVPATKNGIPVEQPNWRVRVVYLVEGGSKGARTQVVNTYQRSYNEIKDGRVDDAIRNLEAVQQQSDLNFYERTIVAFALAEAYLLKGNYDDALANIRDATYDDGSHLDAKSQIEALKLRVKLEAHAGQIAQAYLIFNVLNEKTKLAPDDPIVQMIAKLHAYVDSPETIAVSGRIDPDASLWWHEPFRRRFGFTQVQGKLDHFDLRCDQQTVQSAISEKASWTIPNSFSGCFLYVYGSPGTTFQVLEAQ